MEESHRAEEHINQQDALGSAISFNRQDFIDLTESNDSPTTISSVASYSSTISPLESAMERNSEKRALRDSESLDDSVSIVYEDIKTPPDLQIVGDNIVGQLLKEVNSNSCHISRKLKVGSKSVNLSVSINTSRRIRTEESTSDANIKSDRHPEVQEIKSKVTKPPTGVECGICFDASDEISASGRKLLSTTCGHIFCSTCFTNSMKVAKHCPNCRRRLSAKQFHPLYL